MIPEPRLRLPQLRTPRRARLKPKRNLLERRVQAPPRLPPERAPLPRLVLGELPCHLVELGPVADLRQRLLLLAVFLALMPRSSALRPLPYCAVPAHRRVGIRTRMCRTLIDCAPLTLPPAPPLSLLSSPPLLPFLPPPLPPAFLSLPMMALPKLSVCERC